jgi:hypothetical protein
MFSETRFHHRLHLSEAEIFASEQERRLRDIPPLNTLRVLAKRFDLFSRRLHVRVAIVARVMLFIRVFAGVRNCRLRQQDATISVRMPVDNAALVTDDLSMGSGS